MSKVKSQKSKASKGFTVLETIVSIAVVSVAIAGAITAVRTGLIGSSIAKEQVKAFYLAQEAIEVIRNMRDENVLTTYNGTPTNWLTGIALPGDPCDINVLGRTCTVDASTYTLSDSGCGGWNSCPFLRQNEVSSSPTYLLHGYNGSWTQTQFRREIQIENVSANEVSVTIQISWNHGATARSFKTKTSLMNWF